MKSEKTLKKRTQWNEFECKSSDGLFIDNPKKKNNNNNKRTAEGCWDF